MNATYIALELRRQVRDLMMIMFMIALPVAMYLLFGTQEGSDTSLGNGNAAFYVIVSMGFYGAATGIVSVAGTSAAETMQGWARAVALTRAPRLGYVLNKTAVAFIVALAAVAAVYVVGAATGARADLGVWAASLGITMVCLIPWAVFGLAAGLLFRSDSAVGVATGALTFFAFFGNVFMPLSGTLLDISRWTPLYGMAALVRWPLTEGALVAGGKDELWVVMLSAVAWTLVFLAMAAWGARRSTARR